jgi:SRSO17 transposase
LWVLQLPTACRKAGSHVTFEETSPYEGAIRGLQRFLSDVHWDEEQMRWNYHQLVAEKMGTPEGVLMFDETGFVKKGTDSVGVARQYCGTLGKVENCQVGVFAGYASQHGYALVDKRLFLPEAWFTDA